MKAGNNKAIERAMRIKRALEPRAFVEFRDSFPAETWATCKASMAASQVRGASFDGVVSAKAVGTSRTGL